MVRIVRDVPLDADRVDGGIRAKRSGNTAAVCAAAVLLRPANISAVTHARRNPENDHGAHPWPRWRCYARKAVYRSEPRRSRAPHVSKRHGLRQSSRTGFVGVDGALGATRHTASVNFPCRVDGYPAARWRRSRRRETCVSAGFHRGRAQVVAGTPLVCSCGEHAIRPRPQRRPSRQH